MDQSKQEIVKPVCHVVVVTFNGAQWLDKCLGSVLNSSIPVRLIVIDNGSTDATIDLIKRNFAHACTLIQNEQNLGFGAANNIGLRIARSEDTDYVFLLNQDAWVEPDTIEGLIDISKGHPECGIISPIHLNGEGNALDYLFSTYLASHNCPGLYSDALIGAPLKDIYYSTAGNAAAWLLPRATLEKIGGFCPLFFHYGEDDNYIDRVLYHKMKLGIAPGFRIYHDREHRPDSFLKSDQYLSYKKNKLLQLLRLDNSISKTIRTSLGSILFHIILNTISFKFNSVNNSLKKISFIFKIYGEVSTHRNLIKMAHPTYISTI